MTTSYTDTARHPLATKEGWASFAAQATHPASPRLLPASDFDRLDGLERDLGTGTGTGTPTIHPPAFPPICVRHNRWLDDTAAHRAGTAQVDLALAPEILTAHRRYQRRRTRIAVDADTSQWCQQQLLTATAIVSAWVSSSRYNYPRLHRTWTTRTAALWPGLDALVPSAALVFPEAVALAEILTDLQWRHRVAAAWSDTDLEPFFHRIATRLGQTPAFATRIHLASIHDPLRAWINIVRHHPAAIPTRHWPQAWQPGLQTEHLSEIRHFR